MRELPDFGECVWYLNPESKEIDKAGSRWSAGIYVGIREEPNEILMATNEGAIEVMPFRRRPEEQRWNKEEFENEGFTLENYPRQKGN